MYQKISKNLLLASLTIGAFGVSYQAFARPFTCVAKSNKGITVSATGRGAIDSKALRRAKTNALNQCLKVTGNDASCKIVSCF